MTPLLIRSGLLLKLPFADSSRLIQSGPLPFTPARDAVVRIRSRLLTKLAGWLAAKLLGALFRTLRIKGYPEAPGVDCSTFTPRVYLYSLWHDAILIPIAMQDLHRRDNISALVSRHQDGSYLTEFMRRVRIRSIRGSTNRGGDRALRELIRQAEHSHIFITPDGPRGPRRVLKEGIVFLASRTGRPIVPIASLCLNCWRIRGSWTDLMIPKPFSRAIYVLGKPIEVPPGISRSELEQYRAHAQAEMDRLEEQAQHIARGEEPILARRAA